MSGVRRRVRQSSAFFLALAVTIIWSSAAHAGPAVLDDSGSQMLEPSVLLHWKTAVPAHSQADNTLVGTMTIRVRINVAAFQRRSGRIYLVLPAQPPGPLTVSWSTQGKLQPGRLQSGNRALVFAGPITSPFIEDLLTFQFSVDGRLVQHAFPLSYHFELDEG